MILFMIIHTTLWIVYYRYQYRLTKIIEKIWIIIICNVLNYTNMGRSLESIIIYFFRSNFFFFTIDIQLRFEIFYLSFVGTRLLYSVFMFTNSIVIKTWKIIRDNLHNNKKKLFLNLYNTIRRTFLLVYLSSCFNQRVSYKKLNDNKNYYKTYTIIPKIQIVIDYNINACIF